LHDVTKLRKQRPAPIPQSAAQSIDDFVFTTETKHGNRPSERWIGQISVAEGGAGHVGSYEYEAGSVDYELDEEAEDCDAPLWLHVYVTTPNLQTVKLYEGQLERDSQDEVGDSPVIFFEKQGLPYAHDKRPEFGLNMTPVLSDYVTILLQFEEDDSLPPAAVLDYLRGLAIDDASLTAHWEPLIDATRQESASASNAGPPGANGQVAAHAVSQGGAALPSPHEYLVVISRRSEVTAIDWNMFTDMRSGERADAVEELESAAKKLDVEDEELSCLMIEDEDGRPPLLAADDLPDWIVGYFKDKRKKTHDNWDDRIFEFDDVSSASRAAKDALERMLLSPVRGSADLMHVADGNKDIEERRLKPQVYHSKPQPGSNGFLDKYVVPSSDREATLIATSTTGKAAYRASLFFYCDPYNGDGLHNVVRTEITARVHTYEESNFNSDRPSKEEAAAADPWTDR